MRRYDSLKEKESRAAAAAAANNSREIIVEREREENRHCRFSSTNQKRTYKPPFNTNYLCIDFLRKKLNLGYAGTALYFVVSSLYTQFCFKCQLHICIKVEL